MTLDQNSYAATSLSPAAPSLTPSLARLQLLPIAMSLLVICIVHIIGGLFYFVFVYSQTAAPDADPIGIHMSTVNCMYYGIPMLLLPAAGL